MIHYVTGNIFDSDCQVLVNPVNCKGVMGAGLAKEFALRFPDIVQPYKFDCKAGFFAPGKMRWYYSNGKTILCFPTKDDWFNPSEYTYISDGLISLAACLSSLKGNIAMPKLGCGLGGLDWDVVKAMIESYLGECDRDIFIYE